MNECRNCTGQESKKNQCAVYDSDISKVIIRKDLKDLMRTVLEKKPRSKFLVKSGNISNISLEYM